MARIRIEVSDDRMLAHVSVTVGEALSPAALHDAIAAAGVTACLDQGAVEALASAIASPEFSVQSRAIARGRAAERGFDGYFMPDFTPGLRPGQLRDDGSMDFFDRDLIKAVVPGGQVGRCVAPTEGVAGQRVDGSALAPQAGAASKLALGGGVVLRDDGAVVAEAGGAIVYVPGRSLEVTRSFVHSGSVDLRSGHLNMQGSVQVNGDVTRGFRVQTTGDIALRGQCDGGTLSAGGNIQIAGTLRGGTAGGVEADGDIVVRNAESADLTAGGSITLQQSVNTRLSARTIVATQQIRGGSARAEHSIVTVDAGTPQGVETLLEVGVPRATTDDLRQALARAKHERFAERRGSGDDRGKGGKLGREIQGIARATLAHKLAHAEQRDALMREAFIEVSGTLRPGTVLSIGGHRHDVSEPEQARRVTYDANSQQLNIERIGR